MSSDIEKFMGDNAAMPQQLGPVAGGLDHRNQQRHVVRLRQIRRQAELEVANEGRKLIVKLARMEALKTASTEAKFHLHRAKRESLILADEDPELKAKFALIDDEFLQRFRIELWNED